MQLRVKVSKPWNRAVMRVVAAVVTFAVASPLGAQAIPDPCKLVTAEDVVAVAGPVKGVAKRGDVKAGEIWCEYAPVKGPTYITITLHDGELAQWRQRNGGKGAVSLPELGKDAFGTPDAEGAADVYAKKGKYILRITMPKGPTAITMATAVAKKGLARM